MGLDWKLLIFVFAVPPVTDHSGPGRINLLTPEGFDMILLGFLYQVASSSRVAARPDFEGNHLSLTWDK